MLAKPLAACTHLLSTVSQLFEPQVQKIAVFTYGSPHFCFPWRRPCDYHAICYMDGKTIQCLPNSSQNIPIYLQQFPSYTMLKSMQVDRIRGMLKLEIPYPLKNVRAPTLSGKQPRIGDYR